MMENRTKKFCSFSAFQSRRRSENRA